MNTSPATLNPDPNPMPPMKPSWNPKDQTAPWRGIPLVPAGNHPPLLLNDWVPQEPPRISPLYTQLPNAIDTFTNKALIFTSTCNLQVHNDHLHFLYVKGQTRTIVRAASIGLTITPNPALKDSHLKAALLSTQWHPPWRPAISSLNAEPSWNRTPPPSWTMRLEFCGLSNRVQISQQIGGKFKWRYLKGLDTYRTVCTNGMNSKRSSFSNGWTWMHRRNPCSVHCWT